MFLGLKWGWTYHKFILTSLALHLEVESINEDSGYQAELNVYQAMCKLKAWARGRKGGIIAVETISTVTELEESTWEGCT